MTTCPPIRLAAVISVLSVVGFVSAANDIDIDEFGVRVDRDATGWLFEIDYEIEVEHPRHLGPLEFVVTIEHGGHAVTNDAGQPVQFILPLDSPSDYDDHKAEFDERIVFAVSDVSSLPATRLEAVGAVYSGTDAYPLAVKRTRAKFVGHGGSDGYVVYDEPYRSSHVSIVIGVGSYWVPSYRRSVTVCRSGYVRHTQHHVRRSVGVHRGHGHVRGSRPTIHRSTTIRRPAAVHRSTTTRRPIGVTQFGLSSPSRHSRSPAVRHSQRTTPRHNFGVTNERHDRRHPTRQPQSLRQQSSRRGPAHSGVSTERRSDTRRPSSMNRAPRSSARRPSQSNRHWMARPGTSSTRHPIAQPGSRHNRPNSMRSPSRATLPTIGRSSPGWRTTPPQPPIQHRSPRRR